MELDPITADFPCRTAREEDEEAAERATGGGLAPEAVAMWTPESRAAGRVKTPLMIVATTPESCALLRSAAEAAAAATAAAAASSVSLIGALVLPGLSLSGNTLFSLASSGGAPSPSSSSSSLPPPPPPLPAPADRVCAILSVDSSGSRGREGQEQEEPQRTILVLCQYHPLPDERAFGLAAALFERVDADETLVLSSLPSHLIPGSAGAEEGEPPLYRLQTAEALGWARRAQEKLSGSSSPSSSSKSKLTLAALPPGAAVPGFPAAVVSRAAARQKPAMLLIRADARAGPPPAAALAALASGAAAAVSVSGAASVAGSFASVLGKASAAAASAAAAARADAASVRAAVYA